MREVSHVDQQPGEHGRDRCLELGPAVLAMHRATKNALVPAGVVNPGKVFPDAG